MRRKIKQQKVSPNSGLDYESKEFGMLIVALWPLLFSSRSVCSTKSNPGAVRGAKRWRRKRRRSEGGRGGGRLKKKLPFSGSQKATLIVWVSGVLGTRVGLKKWLNSLADLDNFYC